VFATSLCENAPILLNSAPVLEEKLVRSEEFLSIGTCTFRIQYYSGFSPSPLREGNLLTTPREVRGWDKDQLYAACVLFYLQSVFYSATESYEVSQNSKDTHLCQEGQGKHDNPF